MASAEHVTPEEPDSAGLDPYPGWLRDLPDIDYDAMWEARGALEAPDEALAGRRLEPRRADNWEAVGDGSGCCTSCDGTGYGGPGSGPETNGRCPDCRGAGCAHEGPCAPEEPDPFRCPECNAPEVLVDEFDDQIGFEEQARPVHVTVLGCGHEIVRPGRWTPTA